MGVGLTNPQTQSQTKRVDVASDKRDKAAKRSQRIENWSFHLELTKPLRSVTKEIRMRYRRTMAARSHKQFILFILNKS
jgi:hypothetical protein